ncbi:MAG: class I SAM-dependent methyltransferase [Acidimicrobiales bacterium]
MDGRCRSCGSASLRLFLSLGKMPLADALLDADQLHNAVERYPLEVAFCPACSLVQVLEDVPPQKLFVDNYLYFSSCSPALLRHNREHALSLVESGRLEAGDLVVEIASNDGYFLRNLSALGVDVLGIDPAPTQATAAEACGVPTLRDFFGLDLARHLRQEGRRPKVIVANNVMAHVPDLNGFVKGIATLLADDGVATIENPSVAELVERCAFDTIYHEHHSYFSCNSVDALVRRHGLFLNHVEYFPELHGGTLRWNVGHHDHPSPAVAEHLRREAAEGVNTFAYYADFASRVQTVSDALLALLLGLKGAGASIAAYGAAAKGATLLNFAGIGSELIDFVVDRNEHKQGKYLPGVQIPILGTESLVRERPDYVLLLAWNFKNEILAQEEDYRRRGGRFVVPVPWPEIVE